MSIRNVSFHAVTSGLLLLIILLSPALLFAQSESESGKDFNHRDSFYMNSIGGGDFRTYITSHVTEEDTWAYAMRSFGIFHNLMHEMMSNMVRYDLDVYGVESRIPEFTERISGGGWTDYRKKLAEDDSVSEEWLHFVKVLEIMHDRVHQAMYKSVIYDLQNNQRAAVITDYADENRAPYETDETFPDLSGFSPEFISNDDFREIAWHSGIEGRYLHATVQQMTQFSHMLEELTTLWADHSRSLTHESCRADAIEPRMGFENFSNYTASSGLCADEEWSNLMAAAGLMQTRIHQMMAAFTAYLIR
ncbi:MAG: hypothetical protein LAT84_09920 [Balneolia bacterium]|nr:hypothetical protein [Balneolia bacterium]